MAKKLSKEQLETDVLVTGYAKTISYIQKNTNLLIGITIAVLVLIGGSIGYYFYGQSQERAAQAFLGYSEQLYIDGDYEAALNGDDTVFGVGFAAIISSYGRTNAANLARYYAALSEAELGNSDAALSYMSRFRAPKGILGVGPLAFHAVLLDDAGKYKEAAAKFEEAANRDENPSTTPQNLLRAAQASLLAGDTRKASALVERILKEYETSPAALNAQKIQGQIAAAQ